MNLKIKIIKAGFTYKVMAEKMGVHHRTLVAFIIGEMNFSWKNLVKLLEVLNVGDDFTFIQMKELFLDIKKEKKVELQTKEGIEKVIDKQ